MADEFKFVQMQATTLAGAGATANDTSIILTSLKDPDGNLIAMTDFGTIGFGTIEPNSGTNEEQISFTGVTQNGNGTATLTGVKTVLFVSPYTQTSGLAKTHAGGTTFVISNTSAFYDTMTSKNNDETITGLYTFVQAPVMSASSSPTLATQLVPKSYVDGVVLSGAPNMDLTTKGVAEEATAAEINAGTQAGGTSAELAVNPKFLKDSEYYTLRPTTNEKAALSAASTPTALNPYITKAINDLNELVANKDDTTTLGTSTSKYPTQNATKVYVDNQTSIYKNGNTTYDLTTASGTKTIAHGLGKIPKFVRLVAKLWTTSGIEYISDSIGVFNGTTNSVVYSSFRTNSGQITSAITGSNSTQGVHINQSTDDSTTKQTGVITVDITNVTITWTKTGSPSGTLQILWEAYA